MESAHRDGTLSKLRFADFVGCSISSCAVQIWAPQSTLNIGDDDVGMNVLGCRVDILGTTNTGLRFIS